jgi:hypothetical protein
MVGKMLDDEDSADDQPSYMREMGRMRFLSVVFGKAYSY